MTSEQRSAARYLDIAYDQTKFAFTAIGVGPSSPLGYAVMNALESIEVARRALFDHVTPTAPSQSRNGRQQKVSKP